MTATAARQSGGGRTAAVGDRDGEYLEMQRGHYAAWIHVGVGFFYQVLLFAATIGLAVAALAGLVTGALTDDREVLNVVMFSVDGVASLGLAWLVFRDRWRCIEAFASRYCVGLLNLSLVYVPVVALFYASYRGALKLRRR